LVFASGPFAGISIRSADGASRAADPDPWILAHHHVFRVLCRLLFGVRSKDLHDRSDVVRIDTVVGEKSLGRVAINATEPTAVGLLVPRDPLPASGRPPKPCPALARCRRCPTHPPGRVSGVAPGLARQPSGRSHRRGVADHRRPRPRRTPGHRAAQGVRPRLATPTPDPTPRVAQVGKQVPPVRDAPSLVRALRVARGSLLFATRTTLFQRRLGGPFCTPIRGPDCLPIDKVTPHVDI
jgi:hypothetical protein